MDKKAPTRIPNPPEGETFLGLGFAAQTKSKFKHHDFLIYAVLIIVAVTLIAIVVATVNMYLDQAHFNNEVYKEQSGQIQTQLNSEQLQINALNKKVKP